MKVIKIIVDELPKICFHGNCIFPEYYISQITEYWKCIVTEKMIKDDEKRPSWCPLVIEDECVWVGEYYGYDGNGDMIFVSKKTACSDVHIQTVKVPSNTYCPNCGRKIRYEEENK